MALSAALVASIVPMAALGGVERAQAQEAAESESLLAPAVAEVVPEDDSGLVAQGATDEEFTVQGAVRYGDVHTLVGLINNARRAAGKSPVSLDATLTTASMLRAAELSVFYSHTRPNGEQPNTAIAANQRAKYGTVSEVSAIDISTPQDFIDACRRNENYSVLMNGDFNSVGIGYFSQGATCWNLMFSSATASGSVRGDQRNETRSFHVNYDVCATRQEFNLNTPVADMQQLKVGQTFKMDYCVENAGYKTAFARLYPQSVSWSSSNPAVCTVDATGLVTARAAGSATVTARLGSGKSISLTWAVSQEIASVAPTTVPDQTYTGSPIEPRPTIRSGTRTLAEGTDYTVTYGYNTNVGVASMTIAGLGSFSGSRTLQFRIKPAENWSASLSETQYLHDGTEKRPTVTVTLNGAVLTEDKDYSVSYPGDMTSIGDHVVTVTCMGNVTGSQALTYKITEEPIATESYDVMYRLYNPNSGEHFYTASVGERDAIAAAGWNYEGVGWIAPKTSSVPVYRLYSGTDHHYTINREERDALVGLGWVPEGDGDGIAWYSEDSGDDAKRVPLYRQFNPNVDPTASFNNSGSHNYTMSKAENDALVQSGWNEEGIGWYGIRQ